MAGTGSLRGRDWIHFGLRILLCASAIALLAVTARLAIGWGGDDEEPPTVLPIVLSAASLAIVTDILALFLLFRSIGFITATAILDILVIILCAVGIGSLLMGNSAFYWGLYYHDYPSSSEQADRIVFALNILVAWERILSIILCSVSRRGRLVKEDEDAKEAQVQVQSS